MASNGDSSSTNSESDRHNSHTNISTTFGRAIHASNAGSRNCHDGNNEATASTAVNSPHDGITVKFVKNTRIAVDR